MRIFNVALGLLVCLLYLVSAGAADLSSALKKTLSPWGKSVGVSVRTLDGKEIYQQNGQSLYSPASVAKLVSTSCALSTLGPQYQFKTIFGHTGSVVGKTLEGDLVISGSGDPSFVIEDLKEAIERIQVVTGVEEIHGNILFDGSYFSQVEMELSEGFEGDAGRSFTAKMTAVPLDFNSFSVWVSSDAREAHLSLLPKDALDLKIVNELKVKAGLILPEVNIDYRPTQKQVIVGGRVPAGMEPKGYWRSVPNPYESFARLAVRVWTDLGGKWKAPRYQVVTQRPAFQPFFTYESRPLSRILLDINKLSTNFGAEFVLYAAAAEGLGRPATLEKTERLLLDCIKAANLSPTLDLILDNASGLSRQSKMKPSALTSYLFVQSQKDFFPEYLSTLSVLGRDGTMKRRLPSLAGQARLKTGSIKGVKTLAGYIFPKGNTREGFIVSMLFDCPGGNCPDAKIIQAEDSFLADLISSQTKAHE